MRLMTARIVEIVASKHRLAIFIDARAAPKIASVHLKRKGTWREGEGKVLFDLRIKKKNI